VEVLEARRAIASLREAVKEPANADSFERRTSADYHMIINALEEMLVEVEAPRIDGDKLTALYTEVQRLLHGITRRVTEQMLATAQALEAGASIDSLSMPRTNAGAVNKIIDELSKKFVSAANRRTAEINSTIQARDTNRVDSPASTEDHAPMSTPSQSEIDLKIENMQLRMDGRLSSIEGKMDALAAQVSGSERAMSLLAERAVAAAESAGNLKQTLWITSITTILSVLGIALAAYFGTQASNLSIVSSTISAFEAGRTAGSPVPPTAPQQAPPR
jgi:hypothetical protein